ncbi:alkaline phosphatase family protein [Methylocapsa palsarum]|uniref:Type I phosphodiesterase / nucleotide pyrophosphatase n=1 Tax=Methylocapsa palsarum TaxID=1612308 RepID=A0A1I4CHJ9_9HYPH|nr:alkaline phosphatase family protein [Methylocapsa palsarum]SFK79586.1 Type I phosphodiesterase / nucleotide pyrophosphatase [Methylocapsa palsarum]
MMLRKMLIGLVTAASIGVSAQADDVRHVLLISVDGLHALDVTHYVESRPRSALAELSGHGVTYTNARTPANSDSFPGLLALVTGGSPVSHGIFYDVSYDRKLFDPTNTTCSGTPGNTIVFDESIDAYNGVISLNSIDPSKLPRGRNRSGECVAVYPHDAIRTNTIFEVVKKNGGATAWADKHPAYDLVNGPSGKGVDDLYTPEITNVGGFDATTSVDCTIANDQLKVNAILNEIKGLTHDGKPGARTPAVFGMNFQAVSVAQKLSADKGGCPSAKHVGQPGGYKDGLGTPTEVLAYGLEETDEALASMIKALKDQHLYESTLFIVSAKHGQSPINPEKVNKPGHFADLVAALPDAGSSTAAKAIADAGNCSAGACGFVQDDDIALIWLADQSKTNEVAAYLNTNAKALFIDEVLAGDELKLKFNDPAHDSRTPDIIVQPQYGTIYTTSKKKNAEHGGFSFGDANVALIVSNPRLREAVVKTPVATSQVAPTILRALEIDPNSLNSVQVEHTDILPGLWNGSDHH